MVTTLTLAVSLLVAVGPVTASTTPPRTTDAATSEQAATQTDPIAELASQLDYDMDRIFRFVADEIRYEPYGGILRGAAGTLKARAGNSVDKALLLGALLDASLVPYRFARGPLDEATAATVMSSTVIDADGARSISRDAVERDLDELSRADLPTPAASGPPASPDATRVREIEADARQGLAVAQGRLEETVSMIGSALDGAGVRLPVDAVSLPPAEVTGHTWIQARSGSDWRDLDPTVIGAEPGTVLATASESVDQLPDELRYRIDFQVDVERVVDGRLVTEAVLEHSLFADEVAGVPITFGHVTPNALQKLGVTMAGLFGDGWLDYRPTLDLGATAMVADEAVGIPLDTGGDILSAGGPPSPGAGPVDGEATAEWLEVRITPPGGDAEVARRTIFDRLPADLRAAGQLDPGAVEPIELVDPEGEDDHAYLPLLGDRVFAITTGATSIVDTLANARDGHAMLAIAFGGLRDRLVEAMALDAGARTFVASPNVVSVSMEVLGDGPVPIVRTGLDIWHRDDGVLPLSASSTSAAEARILKGVADHVTERYVVDRLAHEVGSEAQPTGVGLVFEAAAAQGIPIRVLRDTIAEPLDVGPRARALIEKALDEGDVVLVPAAPVTIGDEAHIGWWRVDPATGATTDVMDGGGGASAVAYGRLLGNLYRTAYVFCRGVGAAVAVSVIQASVMMHDGLTPKAAAYVAPGGAAGTVCTVVAAG